MLSENVYKWPETRCFYLTCQAGIIIVKNNKKRLSTKKLYIKCLTGRNGGSKIQVFVL